MKASLSWLKDYVDIKWPAEKLAAALTMSGAHVENMKKVGQDYCFEFEITSNRNDCLSIIGIAREIAAITGKKLKIPHTLNNQDTNPKKQTNSKNQFSKFQIKILDDKLCSKYTGRIITDVKVGPSPKWIQDRLTSIGVRPVNNIVDITNYVLIETGQPMHAFDFDKIKGNVAVRKAKSKETITTIDGVNRVLEDGMLVIADDRGLIAVAGVMGGLDTEVSNDTKNILLESAHFNPASVRRTSRKLGLSSESSYRFERNVDRAMILQASNRAAIMLKKSAEGEIGTLVDVGDKELSEKNISFDPERSNEILGIDIPMVKQKKILESLSFQVKSKKNNLFKIRVPSFRQDISQDVDISEEIARIYGYDKIPLTIPKIIGETSLVDKAGLVKKEIVNYLSSSGLDEIMTYSLISPDLLELFSPDKDRLARVSNPLSKEQELLTQTLLPGVLKAVSWNINRKNKNLKFFELGKVYKRIRNREFQEEPDLCVAITGLAEDNWLSQKREEAFFDLKGIIVGLFEKIGIRGVKFVSTNEKSYFAQGVAIIYKNQNIGIMGELGENILKKFDIEQNVYALELTLSDVIEGAMLEKVFKPIPKYPSITRDISLIIGKNIPAESIIKTIREINSGLIKEITLMDAYAGKQIPQGNRAFLYRIEYRDDFRTLTDSEVEEQHKNLREILSAKLGVSFR